MNAIKLFIIGILLFGTTATKAQVSINVNIGTPPAWGPEGYDNVSFYYLPDIQIYFDIKKENIFILETDDGFVQEDYQAIVGAMIYIADIKYL